MDRMLPSWMGAHASARHAYAEHVPERVCLPMASAISWVANAADAIATVPEHDAVHGE